MEKYVLAFEEIGKQDIAIAGGKGANLGEMVNCGIPVPAGGVLCAAAYDRYMEQNNISVKEIMEKEADVEKAAQMIRDKILNGAFEEEIKKQIVSFYRSLGEDVRVAVRSSATAEDLEDASFAGQQETYLNVVGETALFTKIKECYASLWGNRAVSYRKRQGYDKQTVALAVVIQQMIESEYAGVLFTQNPATAKQEVLINASYGLGEAVVSGMVSPDEYHCEKDGALKSVVIGKKEKQILYDQVGTKVIPVSAKQQMEQVLQPFLIRSLVLKAMEVEAHYGHPMDIEWAVRDNEIYILQARSITTHVEDGKWEFTEKDFAGLPKVRSAKESMRESVLFNLEKLPRSYYPLDHDFGDAVGKQKEVLFSEAGLDMGEMCPINADGITSFSVGGMKMNKNIVHIFKLLKQMMNDAYNVQISTEKYAQCVRRLKQERLQHPATIMQTGESLARMKQLICDTAYARFRYAIFPQVLKNRILNRTLEKVDPQLNAYDLLEGLSYVTTDVNRSMKELVEYIKAHKEMECAVAKGTYEEIGGEYPELAAKFEQFMEKYGDRSDFNCYCFVAKSWKEEPERFLRTLRTMLRTKDTGILTREESEKKFRTLMQRIKESIGEKKFVSFEKKVQAVRHYHYIREATQYLWESEFAYCRKLLKLASEQLGIGYDDLLYLFSDEFFDVCKRGALTKQDQKLIERRKAKRPLAEAYWDKSISEILATDEETIKGISGSVGKATGKVCVIKGTDEFDKLEEGEILVCSYTDPEWTPLFTLAAGVVVDTGGSLSHAAIVAREYHIPAILATGNATKRLQDGDMVMLDGTKGIVTILNN